MWNNFTYTALRRKVPTVEERRAVEADTQLDAIKDRKEKIEEGTRQAIGKKVNTHVELYRTSDKTKLMGEEIRGERRVQQQ